MIDKYKKGKEIEIKDNKKNKAIITSDLIKFKKFYAIYADIIDDVDDKLTCYVYKINDKVALIIRNKNKLLKMRFNYRRKKSYILP